MQLETGLTRSHQGSTPTKTVRPGLLFVLSAPSGTGKDTVITLLKEQGYDFFVVPSVTTRSPRQGESEGDPYYFLGQKEFDELVAQDELLEYANVHGNWYGQPRKPIREHLERGSNVLLKIDVQGAATVRQKLPEAIFIFLTPGSIETLSQRLNERHTETEEELQRRLTDAQHELENQYWYDYVVENLQGRVQEAVDHLKAIMMAERCRTKPRYVKI